MIWDQIYGGLFHEPNAGLQTLNDGNVAYASALGVASGNQNRLQLVKIDPSSGVIWSKTYDGNATASTLFVVKEIQPGDDLISAGFSYRPGYLQGALLRTNSQGDSLWMRYYHYYDSLWTEGKGTFRDVLPTPDGGFIAAGTAYGSNNPNDTAIYSQDTWIVQVDSMGCLVPGCDTVTGIESLVTNYRDALVVAPNPAHEQVTLSWQLPARFHKPARLTIVNAAGAWMHEGPIDLAAGSLELDVSSYPAGMYHAHIVQEGSWITGAKLVVQ